MAGDQDSTESVLRHSIRLIDTFLDPAISADDREFVEQEIVKADALLLDRQAELPELRDRLRRTNEAHALAVADYITLLLWSYDDAAYAAQSVIAKVRRNSIQN